jgi:DNA-binding XRE family transcriptional regulator
MKLSRMADVGGVRAILSNPSSGAVAHDAGITTATFGVIERGLSNPTWATVKGIAAALDVSMAQIAAAADRIEKP